MDRYMYLLLKSKLFNGLTEGEIEKFLNNSDYDLIEVEAKKIIEINLQKSIFVIDGAIMTYENTSVGNKRYINTFSPDSNVLIAVSQKKTYPSVITEAKKQSLILVLATKAFTQVNPAVLVIQNKVQQNIIDIFYDMTENVLERTIIVAEASARTKILKYLLYLKKVQKQNPVTILLSRSELASHLSIDTSTLMRELKALKQEGVIDYSRKTVTINTNDESDITENF